jgi:NAD(P) transhydrogenase subunit alpha
MEDEVIRGVTIVREGAVTWPPPAPKLSAQPAKPAAAAPADVKPVKKKSPLGSVILLVLAAAAAAGIGFGAPPSFLTHFTVFVLACFIGYMVIWNVTPALHTPLMSVTNAISSIIVIGALIQVSSPSSVVWILAAVAITITSVNITGGFAVTRRMLKMFRK